MTAQWFTLDDDEREIAETAAAFAAKRLAPHALDWDATKHFPTDVLGSILWTLTTAAAVRWLLVDVIAARIGRGRPRSPLN